MSESAKIEKLGWEAIIRSQPDKNLPDWVIRNVTSNKKRLSEDVWELSIYLFKKRELRSGESWEKRPDGSKMLVRVDPDNGEKRCVLTYRVEEDERVELFCAEVKVQLGTVSIKRGVNLANLNPSEFELFYDDGYP